MKVFGFRGGIHPEGRKQGSAATPIRTLPMPQTLVVPLQQHIGAPARPLLLVGDRVLKGQMIAAGVGMVSAPVHAPTSGRIVAIGDHVVPHPSGLAAPAITIEADGEDTWIACEVPADPFALSPEQVSERVAAAGVVGLGGATFPSAVKLNLSRKSGVHTLILNGGECEPYLTCDDRLMQERASETVAGIRLIRHAVGAKRALVGIEDNKPEALAAMRAAAGGDIEVVAVPARYPMGWEKQMITVLTGQEVPAEGRAAEIGILVHNIATAWAVWQAVAYGRPLVSRIVTVSGGACTRPGNVEAPIGAPVGELLEFCGGLCEAPARLVLGGPMMGHQFSNLHVPVAKGTSGVLALTAREVGDLMPGACIRCSTCVRACPAGLLPLEMAARIKVGDLDGAVDLGLKDCIACASCSYVCPAHIPLAHYFNHAKGELANRQKTQMKNEATKQLAAARQERLDRITREREEAARARAARKAAEKAAAEAAAALAKAAKAEQTEEVPA